MIKHSAAAVLGVEREEQREGARYNVHFMIDVRHRSQGNRVGHVINLGTQGMAVISKVAIEPNAEVPLKLEADLENGSKQMAELDATAVYAVNHSRPGLFIVGFQFADLTPKARIRIKNIIKALQMRS